MSDRDALPPVLTRREAVARLAWLLGGAIVGAEHFLHGTRARGAEAGPAFTPAELALLDEIGETIIPATDTPGAKAAKIGAFMAMMVNDCYDAAHQEAFRSGLLQVDRACREQHGLPFMEAAPEHRTALLNRLNEEAPLYFKCMKQLTLLGYFTSEIGCTQALRYEEVPGAFHGNVPYRRGDRAWFTPPDSHLL